MREELTCSMSNEYLWLMEFQIAWGVFVVSATNHSLFTKSLVQDLEIFGNVRNFFPFQPWTIFPRKLTWELGSCVQKMAPVHCQSCCFRLKGEGPQNYAFTMWPIRKAFVMISYRAHHLWNFESVKEFLPSLLLWQFRQQSRKTVETTVTVMWGRHLS
jgi:hypothetical protein